MGFISKIHTQITTNDYRSGMYIHEHHLGIDKSKSNHICISALNVNILQSEKL